MSANVCCVLFFFFFKQKTAYEMRISDWSSDVCSSDLKATHKWEEIRKIMIASGRGTDRIDVMIDLGEKKARKQLPPCFSITPEMQANLAAHDDVIEVKLF